MNKYSTQTCAGAAAVTLSLLFHPVLLARPLDATGKCASGGEIKLASQAHRGDLAELAKDRGFAAGYGRHAGDMPEWVTAARIVSGKNREYAVDAMKVVVSTACDPANCERSRIYIGYVPGTGAWGASLYFGGQVTLFGEPILPGAAQEIVPDEIAAALVCAQNLDWGG